MMKQIALWAALGLIAGCSGPQAALPDPEPAEANSTVTLTDEEVATQTLSEMLAVAQRGDFDTYVDVYYGESHKFRSPADRDALVRRFKEKSKDALVKALHRAADLPVKIDGEKAFFVEGGNPVFILHRDDKGAWKFHL